MKRKIPSIVYFIVAAVYFILLAWLMSCNTPKKLAKKKEQAYQTVLTDSAMFKSIGDKYRKINPCINDTIIGETEVLILSDTVTLPGSTDTLIRPDTVRITNTKTNTVTKYIVDNKAIQELQDSLHAANVREASFKGQLLEKIDQLDKSKAETSVWKKEAKKRFWINIGLLVALFGSLFWKFYPNISKLFKN